MTTQATKQQQAIAQAIEHLIEAIGQHGRRDMDETPARVAELYTQILLKGYAHEPEKSLGDVFDASSHDPIAITGHGCSMVCPHHLTVALGDASLIYIPDAHISGFGGLARLIDTITARLILQEEATQCIADTLMKVLRAKAVGVRLRMQHPCYTLCHPRAQNSTVLSWAFRGSDEAQGQLTALLKAS